MQGLLIYSNVVTENCLLLFNMSDADFSPLSNCSWPGTQEIFIFMGTSALDLTLDLPGMLTGAVVVTLHK